MHIVQAHGIMTLGSQSRMEEVILTTRAIRSTPKLPSGAVSGIVQRRPFYLFKGIKLVENEDPDQAPLQSDEIIYMPRPWGGIYI